MPRTVALILTLSLLFLPASSTIFPITSAACLSAADWPQFRGPAADGVSPATNVPVEWDATKNVAWKVSLHRPANGSPIVAAGRVFVTGTEDEGGRQRSLYAFDADTGESLWKQTVEVEKVYPTHGTNPYAGTTPASDGQRVVVWHASGGLHCYDVEGKPLWSRNFGEFEHMWGYGTSPILHEGRVILSSGPGKQEIWLAAFDLKTGDTIWKTKEPMNGDGDRNAAGRYMGTWSAPALATSDGQQQIILPMPTRVNGYDLNTGEILWSVSGVSHGGGDLAYSAPVVSGDVVFFTAGFQGATMAFKLGGRGDVTESNRLYRTEKSPQSIGSGVAVDGYVYRVNAGPGTIECIDPKTGEIQWAERGPGANMWGSLVLADGRLYVTNQQGATVVFKPNPREYEQLAVNRLGEPTNATPAIVDGRVYLRTSKHLWCISE